MSTAELIEQLRHLDNADRLAVIEAASRLIREELGDAHHQKDAEMRQQAAKLKHLYEPGGELTEWTALDSEDFSDDSLPR